MQKIFLCLLVLGLFSCEKNNHSKHQIICTTSIVQDIVSNLLPENFEVKSLMGYGVDPHSYKTSAKDNQILISASAYGVSGLNLEHKLIEVFNEVAQNKPVISISDGINENNLISLDVEKTKYDPHIWMDIQLIIEGVKHLSVKFQEAFPDDKDKIQEKSQKYLIELENAYFYMDSLLSSIPKQKRVLITVHNAFSYFANRFDFEAKSLQGVSTLSESSLQNKISIVDYIIEKKVKAVFAEHAVNSKNISSLIEACLYKDWEVKIGKPLYSDSFGELGTTEGSYIGMQKYNALVIYEALK